MNCYGEEEVESSLSSSLPWQCSLSRHLSVCNTSSSEETSENSFETRGSSSMASTTTMARYSKGHPSFSKAVGIPVVPLAKTTNESLVVSPSTVPPEKINAIASSLAVELDFGEIRVENCEFVIPSSSLKPKDNGEKRNDSCNRRATFISRVKKTFKKRSSSGKSEDCRRPSSNVFGSLDDLQSEEIRVPLKDTATSYADPDTSSNKSRSKKPQHFNSSTLGRPRHFHITKPSVAPPPPPPQQPITSKIKDLKQEEQRYRNCNSRLQERALTSPPLLPERRSSLEKKAQVLSPGKDLKKGVLMQSRDNSQKHLPKTGLPELDDW